MIFSTVHTLITCFTIAYHTIQVLLKPFGSKFRVTEKGISRDHYFYNFNLALPLIIFFILNLISLIISLLNGSKLITGISLSVYWSSYNLLVIGIALLACLDQPKPSIYDSFPLIKKVKIIEPNPIICGKTLEISEEGATISVYSQNHIAGQFTLKLDDLKIDSYIIGEKRTNIQYQIKIKFKELTLQQHKKIINLLYSHPQRWKNKEQTTSPGDLSSI